MSYTIAFSNPPATGNDLINQTAPAFIGAQNNNFSVSQTFGAGIVDSGNLSVTGTSNFTGVCTFQAVPVFSAGINVSIDEADLGTLEVSGLSSLNGGLKVLGSVTLPSASVADSALTSNVDLLNVAQTISAVKTFSAVPVLSGASITSNTIPASSLVNSSITSSQIASAGIGQASLVSGYVDLVNAQSIAGQKSFTAAASFQSGLSSAGGAQILGGTLSCTQLSASTNIINSGSLTSTTGTFSGAVSCTQLTCSSAVDTGTLSCTSLTCSALTDTGALTSTTAVHSGLVTCNAGITIPAGQTASLLGFVAVNATTNAASIAGGVTTLTLNGYSHSVWSASLTATMTALTISGAAQNADFDLFVTIGSAGVNINKALTSGGITIYNNLAGNQAAANGSRWWFQGKFVSSTILYLTIDNVT